MAVEKETMLKKNGKQLSSESAVRQKSSKLSLKGATKFARRTKESSKNEVIIVNDEVSLTYGGKTEFGIVRYIGQTAFSTGKWCGIELLKDVGKHNGSVKGKVYFTCPDNCGVFVPLQKVNLIPKSNPQSVSQEDSGNLTDLLEEEENMKITLRSVKNTTSSNELTNNSRLIAPKNRNDTFSRSSDSGIESPTRSYNEENYKIPKPKGFIGERAQSPTKSIVISSFITPSPKKAIMKSESLELLESNKDNCNNSESRSYSSSTLNLTDSSPLKRISVHTSDSITSAGVFLEDEVIVSSDKKEDSLLTNETPESSSKIPRRRVATTPQSTEHEKPVNHDISTSISKKPLRKNMISFSNTKPKSLKRSSVKDAAKTFEGSNKTSEGSNKAIDNKKTLPIASLSKRFGSSKKSVEKQENSHNEPGFVMGNKNANYRSSSRKNSVGCEAQSSTEKVGDIYSQRELKDTVVIDKKLRESGRSKPKEQVQSNGYLLGRRSSKDLQKELEDLKNQLNERNERITELEVTLKNNNNIKVSTQTEYEQQRASSQLELQSKSNEIHLLEETLSTSETLMNTSSNGLQALSIVIQYYINQLERASSKLLSEQSESKKISEEKQKLQNQYLESIEKLDSASEQLESVKCQCANQQEELKSMRVSHENEIKELQGKFHTESENIRTSTQLDKEQEIQKALEQHKETLKRLKDEHEDKVTQLKILHTDQYEEAIKEKEKAIKLIISQHKNDLDDLIGKHVKATEDFRDSHVLECKELQDEINSTKVEKETLNEKLKEVMKELESDTKVQAAVSQYKHLPAELDSLQVVLDMKNEEIKNMRIKCMELEKRVDDYYELQTKFNAISQQNQSLNELLKKKTKAERQISVERDSLIERFERESRKVSRLSMEKEELIWRASNPDLSFGVLDEGEEEEANDSPPSPLRSSGSFSTTPPKNITKKIKRRSMNF